MKGPGSPPSLLFRLIIPATSVFIITILSMIAVIFSDERAPVARFLNTYGNRMLLVEFIVVLVLAVLAMAMDRRQILKDQRSKDSSRQQPPESA